jgi:uncharacterized Zn-finger protein
MYYTIYCTTDNTNGKKYLGKHITNNLNDDYLGSGIYFSRALKKHHKENFSKEILYVFDNEIQMNDKEIELINEDIVNSENYYNLALGGQGGCIVLKRNHPLYNSTRQAISSALKRQSAITSSRVKRQHAEGKGGMKGKRQSEYQKRKAAEAQRGRKKSQEEKDKQRLSFQKTINAPGYMHPKIGIPLSEETKSLISKNHADVSAQNNPMYGKKHDNDARKKISEALKNSKKHECPYCKKLLNTINFVRWHGDNCKNNHSSILCHSN